MNVKMISKALHTLSLLSEEDYDLVLKLRALTEDEREQFRTALELQKPATKKASKKSSKSSSSKSPRATGIEQQLSRRREQGRVTAATTKDDNYDGEGQCSDCGMAADMPVHSPEGGYITYHPFRLSAPPAPTQSPANGASSATERNTRRSAPPSTPESDDGEGRSASLSVANSEASAVSAHAATGGSSE